jgi:serine protease
VTHQGDYWKNTRALKIVARDERPDVINMSFGGVVTTGRDAQTRRWDRILRIIADRWGALTFASAGNEGMNIDAGSGRYLPCASTRAVCVGGMGEDTTTRHAGSNYGTQRSSRSVEIYGPFCVVTVATPAESNAGEPSAACGTSVASPFVAGVAALLRVADPSISPGRMKEILLDTAHTGGLGAEVTGHVRRIDAHMAVAEALDTTWTPPTVTIAGAGTYPVGEVELITATARSYSGEALPVRWHSSRDGWLVDDPTNSPIGTSALSPGRHIIRASATDRRGLTSGVEVEVNITHLPPEVRIVSPETGDTFFEGFGIDLIGFANDPNPFGGTVNLMGRWTITDEETGQTIWSSTQIPTVSTEPLSAGNYRIHFHAVDPYGVSAEDEVTIEVRELDPGWVPPWAQILEPPSGTTAGATPQTGLAKAQLVGRAFGVDGNPIAGERMRWTATNDQGETIVLCTGSSYPGSGTGGGFIVHKDCGRELVDIPLSGPPFTVWAVKLEAVDSAGVRVHDTVSVTVVLAVG